MLISRENWEALLFPAEVSVERQERYRMACFAAKNILEHEISARQRQVLVLYYQEKKTMPEIAAALGVNVSTVSRTHRRACTAVRSRLKACGLM